MSSDSRQALLLATVSNTYGAPACRRPRLDLAPLRSRSTDFVRRITTTKRTSILYICCSHIIFEKGTKLRALETRRFSVRTSSIEGARTCLYVLLPLPPDTVQSMGNFFWNPSKPGVPYSLPTHPL